MSALSRAAARVAASSSSPPSRAPRRPGPVDSRIRRAAGASRAANRSRFPSDRATALPKSPLGGAPGGCFLGSHRTFWAGAARWQSQECPWQWHPMECEPLSNLFAGGIVGAVLGNLPGTIRLVARRTGVMPKSTIDRVFVIEGSHGRAAGAGGARMSRGYGAARVNERQSTCARSNPGKRSNTRSVAFRRAAVRPSSLSCSRMCFRSSGWISSQSRTRRVLPFTGATLRTLASWRQWRQPTAAPRPGTFWAATRLFGQPGLLGQSPERPG